MNAFADWLFGLLFGWMGSAANRAWNAVVNASGGISSFFSKYWLLLLLAALIAGTVLDYAVWLVRWRPYLVWRSWLTRTLRRRHLRRSAQELEQTDMDENARGALAEWVASPEDDSPLPYDSAFYGEPDAQAWAGPNPAAYGIYPPEPSGYDTSAEAQAPYPPQAAAWPYDSEARYQRPTGYTEQDWPGFAAPPPPLAEEAPLWPPSADSHDAYGSGQPAPFPPLSSYQNQPLIDYPQNAFQPDSALYGDGQNPAAYSQESPPVSSAPPRRRRSERKQRPLSQRLYEELRQRIGRSEDEETMLDGLPPTIRPEDAFHEAVYPQGYRYQPTDSGNTPEEPR